MNVTLAQIETFVAVAERGGFRAAGDQLGLSQSAVSLRIRQIEERLQVRLFDRTTRRVSLTREGQRLLSAARQTLHDFELMMYQLRQHAGSSRGSFRMASLPSAAATIVPVALREYGAVHPNIKIVVVDCVADRATASVLAGEVEFALATDAGRPEGVDFDPLFEDSCYVVVPRRHPLSDRGSVRLDELAKSALLLPVTGSAFRTEIDAALAKCGVDVQIEREATNLATLMAYAESGMGITFVPSIMSPRLDLSRCTALRIEDGALRRRFGVLTSHERHLTPAASAFVGFLRERLTGMMRFI